MKDILIIIALFLIPIFAQVDVNADTMPKSMPINRPKISNINDFECAINAHYNAEGCFPSEILNVQLILNDSIYICKAKTMDNYFTNEYIIITLKPQVANCFKALLYDLYSSHNSVIKDKYINEPHAICSASSEWCIKLRINGKNINETIDILGYTFSYDDPFNIQFEQIMQLVYAITNKIERDILRLKHIKWEAEEWISKTFNDEYYEPYNNINSNKYQ